MENTTVNIQENLIKKLFFTFLGGIVGLIPTIISLLIGYYIGYLYALVPIGCIFGNVLSKTPINRNSIIITIVLSLILPLGAVVSIYYFDLSSLNLTFADLFANAEAKSSFINDLVMSVVFSALGIYISWRFIRKYAK